MTEIPKFKYTTIKELRDFPLKDIEFVRFLKEHGAFKQFIMEMHNERQIDFQTSTLRDSDYHHEFFGDRAYFCHGFNVYNTETPNHWMALRKDWQFILGQK